MTEIERSHLDKSAVDIDKLDLWYTMSCKCMEANYECSNPINQ